jgi:hypothetical protein
VVWHHAFVAFFGWACFLVIAGVDAWRGETKPTGKARRNAHKREAKSRAANDSRSVGS